MAVISRLRAMLLLQVTRRPGPCGILSTPKRGSKRRQSFSQSWACKPLCVALHGVCDEPWANRAELLTAACLILRLQAVGNHEFDYGPDWLTSFVGNASFPVLSCNMDASQHASLAGKVLPYTIVTLPISGSKVGIIGLTTPDTAGISSPGANVTFKAAAAALPACIAGIKAAGVHAVIVLSHMGYDSDLALAATASLSDIDVIVGGHSHTLLYGSPAPAGELQVAVKPPNILVSPATAESAAEGPFPTNVLNGAKAIPVVQAMWGSRCASCMVDVKRAQRSSPCRERTWGEGGACRMHFDPPAHPSLLRAQVSGLPLYQLERSRRAYLVPGHPYSARRSKLVQPCCRRRRHAG